MSSLLRITVLAVVVSTAGSGLVLGPALHQTISAQEPVGAENSIEALVARLDLEQYKLTIAGLTHFGDRRQGTQRNREAVYWLSLILI